ncbi:hypothetical protein HanRHA438_Chr07g0291661 [Helianthus annuus]|nr:hypothetical protein HanRHA438_Chr07g0291661 [Helianthus annuus]
MPIHLNLPINTLYNFHLLKKNPSPQPAALSLQFRSPDFGDDTCGSSCSSPATPKHHHTFQNPLYTCRNKPRHHRVPAKLTYPRRRNPKPSEEPSSPEKASSVPVIVSVDD